MSLVMATSNMQLCKSLSEMFKDLHMLVAIYVEDKLFFFFNTNEQWKQILSKINKFITVTLGVNISAWRLSSNKGKKKGTWLKRLIIFFLNRGQMWKFCFWFLFCLFFRFFMCLLHNSDGQKSRFNFYTFVAVDFPLFQ